MNNQTWKYWHLLLFCTRSWGGEMIADCTYVRVCLCLYVLRLSDNWTQTTRKKALRKDGRFSHMGNSVRLHRGTREYLNSESYIELSDVCLPRISHSVVQLAAAVHVTAIVDRHGKPGGRRNYNLLRKQNIPWMSLKCKQCSSFSNEYCLWTVVWPEGECVCVCVVLCVRLGGISCGAPIRRPLDAGLSNDSTCAGARWQWRAEAVDFWHKAATNCEEKVKDIWSVAIFKDTEIQPPPLGLA